VFVEKSEHSSPESQGFVGLTLRIPISMIDQSCCRVVIVGRHSCGGSSR
jgi:hypothetical protein